MAEVEDCLDFFICRLAEISDARKTVLLGRTPYSKKVEIAKVLSQIRTDDAISRHEMYSQATYSTSKHVAMLSHTALTWVEQEATNMRFFLKALAARRVKQ